MAILKGIKCDYCGEEIMYEGIHFRLCGLDFYFDDQDCLDRFIEEITEWEDVVLPEDYDV